MKWSKFGGHPVVYEADDGRLYIEHWRKGSFEAHAETEDRNVTISGEFKTLVAAKRFCEGADAVLALVHDKWQRAQRRVGR